MHIISCYQAHGICLNYNENVILLKFYYFRIYWYCSLVGGWYWAPHTKHTLCQSGTVYCTLVGYNKRMDIPLTSSSCWLSVDTSQEVYLTKNEPTLIWDKPSAVDGASVNYRRREEGLDQLTFTSHLTTQLHFVCCLLFRFISFYSHYLVCLNVVLRLSTCLTELTRALDRTLFFTI